MAAAANATTENRYGPASPGTPNPGPRSSPTALRFGPATEPIVVAHITTDIDRARLASVAPSAAAYRDCRFVACATPNVPNPSSSTSNESATAAARISTAPSVAIR